MADRDPRALGPAPFAPLDFPAVQSVRRDMVDAYHAMTVRLLEDVSRMLDQIEVPAADDPGQGSGSA